MGAFPATPAFAEESADDLFAKANRFYENGNYEGAIGHYLSLVEDQNYSEDLFYNLGNACFRQNQLGEAVLWFRRAQIMAPRMIEPRQNLKTLKSRLGYLDFELQGLDLLLSRFKRGELTLLISLSVWFVVLSLSAAFLSRSARPARPALIVVAFGGVIVSGLLITGLLRFDHYVSVENRAIVISNTAATAVVSPTPDGKPVIDLPPGSEVRLLAKRGTWDYVDIPGEVRGWVNEDVISPLWPISSQKGDTVAASRP